MDTMENLLNEIDNSVTLDELFRKGELIDESGEYDQWYSDAPGGTYNRIKIIKLDGDFYVYKEMVTINIDCSKKTECVAFYKLK